MPRRYPFMQVDAFTTEPLGGNPCAVVFDADDLDAGTMGRIAREMNLSETAFVLRSQVADVRARYFTPATELPMAGHPTIATLHALVEAGRLDVGARGGVFTLELAAGVVDVEVRAGVDGAGRAVNTVTMFQSAPTFGRTYAPEAVAPAFGLAAADIRAGWPAETVSMGVAQLMIPLADLDALARAAPQGDAFAALAAGGDFFGVHLFCPEGATPAGQTFARHFVGPPVVFEDPFTGSATGGMASYLWRHGFIDAPAFAAEQGHWMGRPGKADVAVVGPPAAIASVKVAGPAVTVVTGELRL